MADTEKEAQAQEAEAEEQVSFLEQAITATKQTSRDETEELLKTLTKGAMDGTVKWDKNLTIDGHR